MNSTTDLVFWPILRRISVNFLKNIISFQIFNNGESVFLLHRDKLLYAFGDNKFGWLGVGKIEYLYSPEKVNLDRNLSIKNISVGTNFLILLTTAGTIFSSGRNCYGQLGSKDFYPKYYFKFIPINAKIMKISTGSRHVLALDNNGIIWAWGDNNYYQCMDSKFYRIYKPWQNKQFGNLNPRFIDIACGWQFSMALCEDNSIYIWGQLGSIHLKNALKISLSDQIKSIYGSWDICSALTVNGNVFHSFNLKNHLHFQKIEGKFKAITNVVSYWYNNQLILYSKEDKIYVWNFDNQKLFYSPFQSIADVSSLNSSPNTNCFVRLPKFLESKTNFNNPISSNLTLIIQDDILPRKLYIDEKILYEKCSELLNYMTFKDNSTVYIATYSYCFLFNYFYYLYTNKFINAAKINCQNSCCMPLFVWALKTGSLEYLISLNQLTNEFSQDFFNFYENKIECRFEYCQLIRKYQKENDEFQVKIEKAQRYLRNMLSYFNCAQLFEQALRFDNKEFLDYTIGILDIKTHNIDDRIYLRKYKDESTESIEFIYSLLEENSKLRQLSNENEAFFENQIGTFNLYAIYKLCIMYQRQTELESIIELIIENIKKRPIEIIYYFDIIINNSNNFADNNELYSSIYKIIKQYDQFKETIENNFCFADLTILKCYFKINLFDLNDKIRSLFPMFDFALNETILALFYFQFYSFGFQLQRTDLIDMTRKILSENYVNQHSILLTIYLISYYKDRHFGSLIQSQIVDCIDETNLLDIYSILVQLFPTNNVYQQISKHLNCYNIVNFYDLIQSKGHLEISNYLSNNVETFINDINFFPIYNLAKKFNDEKTMECLRKSITKILHKLNIYQYYEQLSQNNDQLMLNCIYSIIPRNISTKNLYSFFKYSLTNSDDTLYTMLLPAIEKNIDLDNGLQLYKLCHEYKLSQVLTIISSKLIQIADTKSKRQKIYKFAVKLNDQFLLDWIKKRKLT